MNIGELTGIQKKAVCEDKEETKEIGPGGGKGERAQKDPMRGRGFDRSEKGECGKTRGKRVRDSRGRYSSSILDKLVSKWSS